MTKYPRLVELKKVTVAGAAFVAASLASYAQTTTPAPEKKDDTVVLSAFQVVSTQGKGYTSSNSATGFKTNEDLLKIPQAVTLVTRDLIDDIGAVDSSNILQYAGVSNFFAGESFAMRGTRINYPLLDEMPDGAPYLDNVNLDSYTVMRGPAATLYLNAALGGTVLTTSKFPQQTPRYSLTGKLDSNGMYRMEGDFTGPIGAIGDMKFSYRLVLAKQDGESYFKNVKDNRQVMHPSLQMDYKNTTVRLAYDYQQLDHIPNANNFVTPDGKLYTGAGRKEAYFAPGTMENFHRRGVRLIIIQKLLEGWDVKIAATRWWFSRLGAIVFPSGGVNFINQTMTFNSRKNDQKLDFSIAQIDVNGKYHIGPISTQTTFGASYSDEVGISRILGFSAALFPSRTVSMSNPQMDLIQPPPLSAFTAANPGSMSTTYRGNAYIQQTIEVIPNRLTLVGGITYSKIKINSITNTATQALGLPINGHANLHRYGVVFNVTKDAVLYAMESTTFAPTSNRDVNLNTLPAVNGTGKEVGFKTAFLDGRISSTFSVFNLELTNQSFFAGVRPDGISYFAPIGSTTQKGYDFDLAYNPVPGLQFIGTYYNGKVRDQAGGPVANSYSNQVSLVGRYEVQGDKFRGLSFGAGYSRIGGRKLSTGAAYVSGIPGLNFVTPEAGNLINVFASYKVTSHVLIRLNIDNLLDEAYALGAQNAYFVDPSPPRTVSSSITYRF